MGRISFLLIFLVGLALGICIGAGAAHAATPDEIKRSQNVARSVYNLPHQPTLEFKNLDGVHAGEAPWRGCIDSPPCTVWYDSAFTLWSSFAEFCSVTVHEWGHLAGWLVNGDAHSADLYSNMAPVANHHPACGLSDEQRTHLEERREELADILRRVRARAYSLRRTGARRRARAAQRRVKRYERLVASADRRLWEIPGA